MKNNAKQDFSNIKKELINSGLESHVYKLTVGNRKLIVKTAKPGGVQQYEFEAQAYNGLLSLGAKVPQVIYVDDSQLVMTAFDGEELDAHDELLNDSELFEAIAKDLAKCQQVIYKGFGKAMKHGDTFKGDFDSWKEYLEAIETLLQSEELLKYGLSGDSLTILSKFWTFHKNEMKLEIGSLVHGDFAPTAIFVKDGKYEGLIDFGDALIGDPLMDLAYFRFKEITKPHGEDTYQLLKRAYASATHEFPENHENKVIFYMILWGLLRTVQCPDETLRPVFAKKLSAVSRLCE